MVQRISISLPKDLRDSADRMATERKVSRSQLLAHLIQAEQKRLMELELAEGYETLAEEHRRFAETAISISGEVLPPYGHA